MKDFNIEIRLEESYIDKLNGTLTMEFYKQWKDKWGLYERLLASLPGIPYYQARSMMNACNKTKVSSVENNILPFKLKLVEEIL